MPRLGDLNSTRGGLGPAHGGLDDISGGSESHLRGFILMVVVLENFHPRTHGSTGQQDHQLWRAACEADQRLPR